MWNDAWPELTFHVAEWGYADAQAFLVPYGAREYLVEGHGAAVITGHLSALVDRETGEMTLVSHVVEIDRMDAVEPVGSGHPADSLRLAASCGVGFSPSN